jgi:uncharacterized caspase-like protein
MKAYLSRAACAVTIMSLAAVTAEASVNQRCEHASTAIVVGNGDYRDAPKLSNPKRDADLVARTLSAGGLAVLRGDDLNADALAKLVQDAQPANCADPSVIFYFAGQGVSIEGRPYLMPVDFRPPARGEVLTADNAAASGLVPLDDIARVLAAKFPSVYLMFDACRANPFARDDERTNGAAKTQKLFAAIPQIKVVAFSDDPGALASDGLTPDAQNGPFAKAFAAAVEAGETDFDSILGLIGIVRPALEPIS